MTKTTKTKRLLSGIMALAMTATMTNFPQLSVAPQITASAEDGTNIVADEECVFAVSGGDEGTDYTYDSTEKKLTIMGGNLTVSSTGNEQGAIVITGDATVTLDGTQVSTMDIQANASITLRGASISTNQNTINIAADKTVNFITEADSSIFAMYCPAICVGENANLYFSGSAKLSIQSWNNDGLISTVSGNVTFQSGKYYIGGNGTIPMIGGTVTVDGGLLHLRQDFSAETTINGGIISTDDATTYKVYGIQTLPEELATIDEGKSIVIQQNATLTVPGELTLTNNGTIINDGKLAIGGTVTNNGTFVNRPLAKLNR